MRKPIFAKIGTELTELPKEISSRKGWHSWSRGYHIHLWHHATDVEEPFSIFARHDEGSIGFHFGSQAAARERHQIMFRMEAPETRREKGYMISAVVRYRRALRMADQYCWDIKRVASELATRQIIDEQQEEAILDSDDPQALFAALEACGYDAVIYSNEVEGLNDQKGDSLLIWRACQIRSVHAQAFIEKDPRLCPGLHSGIKEWQMWQENERGIDRWLQHFRRGRKDLCLPA